MKKTNVIWCTIFMLTLCSCGNKGNETKPAFCAKLDSVVTRYINNSANADIIFLTFSHINGHDIVSISDGDRYDDYKTDYYVKRGRKLIVIYSTDYRKRDCYFNRDSMQLFRDSIENYNGLYRTTDNTYVSNYVTQKKVYQLISKDSIAELSNDVDTEYIAKDSDVIPSVELNRIINKYINDNPAVLYILKFKMLKGRRYVVLAASQTYDPKGLDGYFVRNNHIVAVYNAKGYFQVLVDKLVREKEIKNVRQAPFGMDLLRNSPECYMAGTKGQLIKVLQFHTIFYVLFDDQNLQSL